MMRRIRVALGPGLLAGLVGAILVDAYILTVGAITHQLTAVQLYTFVASALLGKSAYTLPQAVWIGIAIHLGVSFGWGLGYAYGAESAPQLVTRPLVSGIVFGLFVYLCMQIALALIGIWHAPSASDAFTGIVAHVIFFGLPVAYVVANRMRVATA
jgi:hypothetical protein